MTIRPLLAAVAALALFAAACSSDESESTAPSTAEPTASTPTTDAAPPPSTTTGDEPAPPTSGSDPSTTGAAPDFSAVSVDVEVVATLDVPLALAPRPGSDDLYVAERAGEVERLRPEGGDPETVVDISSEVDTGGERGLLGLTFTADGALLYLSWSDTDGATRLTEFAVADDGSIDAASRREVLTIGQPFPNHNGGDITFGPDGYLYLGLGDGGAADDPLGAGQDTSTPLGSIIRIDPSVDEDAAYGRYGIPDGNIDGTELYIIGVRNPWRISFDQATGELWVADVGQDMWEEVNRLPAGELGGTNLGWNLQEGRHDFAGGIPDNYVAPVAEYDHDTGISVTGGYVYRGTAISDLVGAYVFGDWREAELWAIPPFEGDTGTIESLDVQLPEFGLVSFGQDLDGEIYALHSDGPVYRIVPA